MKITKTFVSVFLVTFLIGYVSVPPMKKVSVPTEITNTIPQNLLVPQIESKIEQEILSEPRIDEEPESKIELLQTGEGFHGDQVEAKSGETWLCLLKENNKYFLRSTKIKVRRVHDNIIDEKAWQRTGKSVTVKGRIKPLFLVRNAEMLSEGEIKSFSREHDSFKKGFFEEYELNGKKFRLKVEETINGKNIIGLQLVLETDEISQVVFAIKDAYDIKVQGFLIKS